jgi:hypothetical protein
LKRLKTFSDSTVTASVAPPPRVKRRVSAVSVASLLANAAAPAAGPAAARRNRISD